jgi:putative copper export protein
MEFTGYLFILFGVLLAVMSVRGHQAYRRKYGRTNISGVIFALGSIAAWLGGGVYILLT